MHNEDGNTTLGTAVLISAIIALSLLVTILGLRTIDSHRAQVAADLSAVAAALALYQSGDPCGEAEHYTKLNGAILQDCRIDGEDAIVEVRRGQAVAIARAGPV